MHTSSSLRSVTSLVGSRIDRYELLSVLGEGGFGTVFRARHLVLDQLFAVKVLHAERADEASIKRFLREAKTVAALGSPHIVKVTDGGISDDNVYFIVMELLDGRPLDALLEAEGALDVDRVVRIGKQILKGLEVAHANGVVHRDLKPANVFITTDEHGKELAKILDFGISKIRKPGLEDITRENAFLGTPRYMAPEQLFSATTVDARADLYATACVLYRALSGALPFDADSIAQLATKIATDRPTPLRERIDGLPASLEYVIDRGLSKDADGRWQTATEMLDALVSVERGVSLDVPIDGPTFEMNVSTADTSPTSQASSTTTETAPVVSAPKRTGLLVALALVLGGAVAFFVGRSSASLESPPTADSTPSSAAEPQEEPLPAVADTPMEAVVVAAMAAEQAPVQEQPRMTHAPMRDPATVRTEREAQPAQTDESRELARLVIRRWRTCEFPSWQGEFALNLDIADGRVRTAQAEGGAPNEATQCVRTALAGTPTDAQSGRVGIEISAMRVCAQAPSGWRKCSSW